MKKFWGIVLIIALVLAGATVVTHELHVWPWPAAEVIEPAVEPTMESMVEPTPSVEEIPTPEEVTAEPVPAPAAEPVIVG